MKLGAGAAAWVGWLLVGCGGAQPALTATTRAHAPALPVAVAANGSASDVDPLSLPSSAAAVADASLEQRRKLLREVPHRLRGRADRVHRWLRDARQRSDARRAACLDDLLSQVHAVERQALSVRGAAPVDGLDPDDARLDRALVRLVVHDESSAALLVRAQQCGRSAAVVPPGRSVQQLRSTRPTLPADPDDRRRPVGAAQRAFTW